ncbi:MAG: hypothetical protein MI924_38245 [Chloroflexales bacterium]|nr:hypothetical protein [Chloroflexales bacterium]
MNQEKKLKYLKGALYIVGAFFVIGVPFMMAGLSSHAWHWTPRQPEYEQMIMGIYAVLGVCLILVAKDPLKNTMLIWFTIWSNIVHGGIMLVQAIRDETDRANLYGDVPALILSALILWYLMPNRVQPE